MEFDFATWFSILKAMFLYLFRFFIIKNGNSAPTGTTSSSAPLPKIAIQLKDSRVNFRSQASLRQFRQQTFKTRSATLAY